MATVSIDPEEVAALIGDVDAYVIDTLIRQTMARMPRWAPCINDDLTDADAAAIAGVITDAIVRRARQIKTGGVVRRSEQHGPFGITEELARDGALFRPDEITELQDICRGTASQATGPIGSFPEAEDYSGLFAKPSDYVWSRDW